MLDWLPPNVSTYGGEIDYFFYVIYYITAAVFFLVAGAMIVFLIKYRYKEGRRAVYTHGNATLEIVWTTATFVAMLILALVSKPLWGRIKQQVPMAQNSVVVQVTGKQFNWEVLYPGPDGEFDTPADSAAGTLDDYQIDNIVHVPVNTVVRVVLKSKDVIHSFFVPQLRLKQDSVPGHTITAWFEATQPGIYEIPCAELCGFGHSGMLGYLYVDTPEDYEKWKNEIWPPAEGAVADSLGVEQNQN
jgi:cytochrome c oxidase subunit 2